MYEVRLLNLKSGKEFSKSFYDKWQKDLYYVNAIKKVARKISKE